MAENGTQASTAVGTPRRRRLTAAARKSSILKAARQEFTETGDMKGATIKAIAERGGISEAVIYRHFESKDQLFYEAVVEPLRIAVDELVAATEIGDLDGPVTPERRLRMMNGLYHQLISTLEEVLPLLGLVLFGDPQVAHDFHRKHFVAAIDRLADAWQAAADRSGIAWESPGMAARAVMGTALILALESRHNADFDRLGVVAAASEGTLTGFFPIGDPTGRLPEAASPSGAAASLS